MAREKIRICAIDPSVIDVGWAVVDGLERDEDGVWHDDNADWRWGCWKIGSHSLTYKLKEVTEWMIMEFDGLQPTDILVLEWPAFFDQERGHVAAKQGHLINLSAVDAYIAGYFRLPPSNFHLLTAVQWKGSISKEITRKRFFRHLGIKQLYTIDHNAVDAVMMLLEFCRRYRITSQIVSRVMAPLYGQQGPEQEE